MLDRAIEFANLLDQARFDDVMPFMAETCEYHYSEGDYQGPAAIANMYRQNHEFATRMFDEVRYSSDVEQLPDGSYRIHFTDSMRLGEKWHNSRFDQTLIYREGLIVEILHHDIRGEAEAMRDFFMANRRNG